MLNLTLLLSLLARGRRASRERPVVAHIGPDAPLDRLALGQDRHGRVIAAQPLGGQDMTLDLALRDGSPRAC
jgi:hypothetical protein